MTAEGDPIPASCVATRLTNRVATDGQIHVSSRARNAALSYPRFADNITAEKEGIVLRG